MSDPDGEPRTPVEVESDRPPRAQRLIDNLWLLLALSVVIPALLYLGWGLWELAELPTWGGAG